MKVSSIEAGGKILLVGSKYFIDSIYEEIPKPKPKIKKNASNMDKDGKRFSNTTKFDKKGMRQFFRDTQNRFSSKS